MGPRRPPLIGEASPEAVPQARVHHDSHLGPVPPSSEFSSETVSKPAVGLPARWGACQQSFETPQCVSVSGQQLWQLQVLALPV